MVSQQREDAIRAFVRRVRRREGRLPTAARIQEEVGGKKTTVLAVLKEFRSTRILPDDTPGEAFWKFTRAAGAMWKLVHECGGECHLLIPDKAQDTGYRPIPLRDAGVRMTLPNGPERKADLWFKGQKSPRRWTLQHAAGVLGLTPTALYGRARRAGESSPFKKGPDGCLRVDVRQLTKWVSTWNQKRCLIALRENLLHENLLQENLLQENLLQENLHGFAAEFASSDKVRRDLMKKLGYDVVPTREG